MSKQDNKLSKRKLRSSYMTSVISISLVLLIIGIIGLLLLNARKISRHVKENIGFSVILKDNIREIDMIRLQKSLDALRAVKSTQYITKEQAAQELQEELGEDFIHFLGYNPLLPSVDVRLFAEYANPDSVAVVESKILSYPQVKEVAYQKSLIEIINRNIKRISIILLAFSTMLLLISISLINNTIRLTIYSKRFIIRTMQLVGATSKFVRTPFVIKGLSQALYAVIIAYILLGGIIYLISTQIPEMAILNDIDTIAILFAVVMIIAFFIVWLSTWFAVNKYLRLKTDDLYY